MAAPRKSSTKLMVVEDNLRLVYLRNDGVDIAYFATLQSHTGLPKSVLASYLGVDPTTIDNYRRGKKKLVGDAAEKLLKLHRLFALGEDLFGTTDEFIDWLHLPSPSLEGQPPDALLHSITGINEVEKQLSRIVHGYVA